MSIELLKLNNSYADLYIAEYLKIYLLDETGPVLLNLFLERSGSIMVGVGLAIVHL